MTNITPCPFCGGKPSIKKELWENTYRFVHTCKGRKPQLNTFSCGYITRKEAIEAWNKRHERTCTNISRFDDFTCSECGGYILNYNSEYPVWTDYCPDCGAKVVEE